MGQYKERPSVRPTRLNKKCPPVSMTVRAFVLTFPRSAKVPSTFAVNNCPDCGHIRESLDFKNQRRGNCRQGAAQTSGEGWAAQFLLSRKRRVSHALNRWTGSAIRPYKSGGKQMNHCYLWNDESGQDIAEYAVMLAVILIIVVGTVRLIGSNANNAFSNVTSSLQ